MIMNKQREDPVDAINRHQTELIDQVASKIEGTHRHGQGEFK